MTTVPATSEVASRLRREPARLRVVAQRLRPPAAPTVSAATTVSLAAGLRLALMTGCGLLALVQGDGWVLLGVAAMSATELVGARRWTLATHAEGLLAAATVVATSGHGPAALPLLLSAAFRAGERGRVTDVASTLTSTAAGLTAGWVGLRAAGADADVSAQAAQWLGLAAGAGLLQAVSLRRAVSSVDVAAAHEAAALASQLTELVRRLPNGLHAPAVAEALLGAAVEAAEATGGGDDRAAVLVRRDGDVASPLAVHGTDRVPWRDPVRSPGTLARAWTSGTTLTEVRPPDGEGRRRGSAMLCVPLVDAQGDLVGLLVVERLTARAFDAATIRRVEQAVARFGPQLQAALLFGELQLVATIAERERLAREMHDGVAQDLVALAFSLELLGRRLRESDPAAEEPVRQVRDEVTRVIRDIRFSIADLRSTVRPERGLGAALSSQVQSLATATGMTMHLSLRESTFRLPAQLETAYLRVAQSMLHDLRCDPGVSEVWVSLDVEPPAAELVVRHDGGGGAGLDDELVAQLQRLGVSIRHRPGELRVASGGLGERIPRQANGAHR